MVQGVFGQPPRQPVAVAPQAPVVFLSYAHADADLAFEFRDALSRNGLQIVVDAKDLQPSDDIAEFARKSVRDVDATVCLISTASLSSAWVVFEAITAMNKEHADGARRLVACAIDQAFLQPEFRLQITDTVDRRIDLLDAQITEYVGKKLDFGDSATERARLIRMRNSLGDVLARLKDGFTVPLIRERLREAAEKVADYIRQLRGQPPSRIDPRDIRARADELRKHLSDGRTGDAIDRMLDFVREFSDTSEDVIEATALSSALRRIENAESNKRLTFRQAEKERQPLIYKVLRLIDRIEERPDLPLAS